MVGRKGVRFFKSKRKDKEIEKERKKKGRKEGANVYKRLAWKKRQWTLSLTLLKRAPFFSFFLRSPYSPKFSSTILLSGVLVLQPLHCREVTVVPPHRAFSDCVIQKWNIEFISSLQISSSISVTWILQTIFY